MSVKSSQFNVDGYLTNMKILIINFSCVLIDVKYVVMYVY